MIKGCWDHQYKMTEEVLWAIKSEMVALDKIWTFKICAVSVELGTDVDIKDHEGKTAWMPPTGVSQYRAIPKALPAIQGDCDDFKSEDNQFPALGTPSTPELETPSPNSP